MRVPRRKTLLGVAGAAAVALCAPAIVLACGSRPLTYIQGSPSSGPAGTSVTVDGYGFAATGSISVYWNDVSGTPLTTIDPNPTYRTSFEAVVTIPSAPPDTYTLVGVQSKSGNNTAYKASMPFTIVSSTPQGSGDQSQAKPSTNSSISSSGQTAPQSNGPNYTAPKSASGSFGTVAIPGNPNDNSSAPSSPLVGIPAAGYAPGGVGGTVIIGAPAPVGPAVAAPLAPAAGSTAPATDIRHDVWSGDKGSALVSAANGPSSTLGVTLLAVGLVGIVGGFALAQVRRRLVASRELQ